MANFPGISWGPDKPVNALRTSRGWLLIDFTGKPRVVAIVPKRRGVFVRGEVNDLGALLNYGRKELSPGMAAELDAVI